ncbi:MAG: glycosyltransferase family 2 protein [bacterium]|jgi:glycosyltransferase involved in cell wall biosynthesis
MNVSLIIAALDEAQTVADVVRAGRRCRRVQEIIVVSDGSRDRTGAVARQAGAYVIELPRNVGKAGAVMVGVERAAGDIVVLLDADLIGLRPDHVDELLHPVLDDGVDMVIGVMKRDLVQNVLPSFSGQRAIPRFHLIRHPELRDKGFGLERALASIARRERWRVRRIELRELSHRLKEEKYGLVRGYRAKLKAAEDLVRHTRLRRAGRIGT